MKRDGRVSVGTALLETDFVQFKGSARVTFPFAAIRAVEATATALVLTLESGVVELEIGTAAKKWAERITKPKGIVDKLGVKPGAKVALVGVFDDAFIADVEAAGGQVSKGARGKGYDHVLFAAEAKGDLSKIEALAERMATAGGIWVVYPKGRKDIREADVIAAGRSANLKDVKVARFSDTHTALRFVVPVAARGR